MQMLLNNRYRVIQTLGSGGFGETFLAEDTQMPSYRRCVIKQLKPIQDNPQVYQLVQQRFQREAAILEELGDNNPQIPRLYAYFSENGQFYLVQEYIEGQTLTAKIQQQGTMSENAVKEILISILPVLDYVHGKGIVHRDIKPDNILIRYTDNKPILIDFGAVKETIGTVVTPSGNSTRSIVIGTPGFMPSEQSVGRPMFASDIYSLGLTAIYLLTAKIPQEMPTDPATGALLWQQYAVNVSPSFVAALDKSIQFNARDRFASAREMLHSLQFAAAPLPPTVPFTLPTVPPTTPSPQIPDHTVAISPGNSYQPPVHNNSGSGSGQKGVLIGSIIAGGLIGASVIIGLALNNRQQPDSSGQEIVSQPTISPNQTNNTPVESQNNTTAPIKSASSSQRQSNTPVISLPSRNSEELSTQIDQSIEENSTSPITSPIETSTPETTPTIEPEVNRPSPEDFVRNYYAYINQRDLETAWNQLSSSYQSNKRLHPQGYDSYTGWWGGRVEQVEVAQVNLVQADTQTATVNTQLKYFMKNGKVVPGSVNLSLEWDGENNRWAVVGAK